MFDLIQGIYCNLQRPNEDDYDTMVRWMKDPFLNTTVFDESSFEGGAKQQARVWIDGNAEVFGAEDLVVMARSAKTGQSIGLVLLKNIDWKSRTADIHYLVGEAEFRHNRYGPEIALLGLKLAFHFLNLHKIYGYVLSTNDNSRSLADFGALEEGVLAHYLQTDHGWADYHLFSLRGPDFQGFLDRHRDGVLRRYYRKGVFTT